MDADKKLEGDKLDTQIGADSISMGQGNVTISAPKTTSSADNENASNKWFFIRKNCPVCLSKDFKIIYENRYLAPHLMNYLIDFYSPQGTIEFEYLEGAFYVLCECTVCNSIFQREVPNNFFLERLYEHWIDPKKAFEQEKSLIGLEYYSKYAQEIMQISSYFKNTTSCLDFFDFGMGWSRWALMAKAFGCNVYGTELSKKRVEYARSNGITVITWDEIPDHRFDLINTEQVFEHLSDPLQTLCHLKKALKTNGLIKISVPGAHDIRRRLKVMNWNAPKGSRDSLNPVAPLEHINFFRRTSLNKMAMEAGMQEVFIPIVLQYKNSSSWNNVKQCTKNILLPIYRNVLKRQNYIFLRNRSS